MIRTTRKQFLSGATALAVPQRGPAAATPAATPAARPKNVLFLLSDQHRPHAMGIDGDPLARTPHMDALARTGVRFDDAYCTNPVCTPSRASILTGLYTHHHRTWNNATPWPFGHKTAAHYFGRAGYMSALIGKMHFVDAQTHGFDYRLDFNDWFQHLGPKARIYAEELSRANSGSGNPQIDDLWRDFGDPWKGTRTLDGRKGSVHTGRVSQLEEPQHFESFVARESVRFLEKHGKEQPFFLISSFLKPHDPFMPAERFARMYSPDAMKLPSSWGKVDMANVPGEIRDSIQRSASTPELLDESHARTRIAMYYASLAQVDEAIGQVLATLKRLGLEDDTIVVYSSDHGEMLGEHGLWGKTVFYEPSVGVPLIVRAPGVTGTGLRSKSPVSQVQIVPTFLELCGIPAPAGFDGPSFVGNLREPSHVNSEPVYAEYALQTPRAKYMIRHGRYKYCHYVNDTPELYDLQADPEEMRNLAAAPSHKDKAAELKQRLFDWHTPPEK